MDNYSMVTLKNKENTSLMISTYVGLVLDKYFCCEFWHTVDMRNYTIYQVVIILMMTQ